MDVNLLRKGGDFDTLPVTYVVFITEHDVVGDSQPIYKIERYISGSGKELEDGPHILYVNGEYRDETPIGKPMHDFSRTDPANMYMMFWQSELDFSKNVRVLRLCVEQRKICGIKLCREA